MLQKFLQYVESAGDRESRELICAQLSKEGFIWGAEPVLVLPGSQQGIELVGKFFRDDSFAVTVEARTYLAALQVFKLFAADLRPFDQGVKPAAKAVKSLRLLYIIPTF